ncbi:MAG: phosphotransferase, partial [Delftia sp.]|nr:phosphotransferase [Delftia sp.]
MKRFQDLTPGGQFRRLRRLAQTALEAYDVQVTSLLPLQHWLNTTFRIETSQAARYALRIHRPNFQTPAMIRSELLWLTALCQETDLQVPEPVLARDWALLTTVSMPGVPEPRHCVLFHWVQGRFRHTRRSATALGRVGAFMARLHLYAESFTSPAGFARQRWDHAGLMGEALGVAPQTSRAALPERERH